MTTWDGHHPRFHKLLDLLVRVPGIEVNETPSRGIGSGLEDGTWWVKFTVTIDHPLAWNVIQEFGHVLNSMAMSERLPTVFKPVSAPPYLNGGPRDYLSWVIECDEEAMRPGTVADWLQGRLPQPIDDSSAWPSED